MSSTSIPNPIPNWIDGQETPSAEGASFAKVAPATGREWTRVARSLEADVQKAVNAAQAAQPDWEATSPVSRGMLLYRLAQSLEEERETLGRIIAEETGRSFGEAQGEIGAAVQCGLFYGGEGQRLYARTTTSGMAHRTAMTVRQPVGVAGLIVAGNTPIANVAWKAFPALICGNGVVLKAAEDTPATAWYFGDLAKRCGLPDGVLNIVQGFGPEAGQPVVEHPDVGVVSFTGSTEVGRLVQRLAGERLAKVSLELGGKNALVVCDDANLDEAVRWAILSAFSNAGQRCASGSRIIVTEPVYDEFRERFVASAKQLRLGVEAGCDLGAVINERQLTRMLEGVETARRQGARVLTGGHRADGPGLAEGFFMMPTVLEDIDPAGEYCRTELFGPITALFRVKDYSEALALVNDSEYGLTACIHTSSLHRAEDFARRARVGVVSINAGTHGSEPHMPFGGLGASGNGTREPGTEALDIYSNLKDVYTLIDPKRL